MSLFNVFGISGSGMSAQSVRLNLTASNLANSESVASAPEDAYRARHPVFQTMLRDAVLGRADGNTGGGVRTAGVVESQTEGEARYEPGHPLADDKGYIYASNVNSVEEMANMISASRSYQQNVEVMKTSKDLLMRTLRLGE
jgi:flagellar basal-body rod protein FlgC